MSESNQGVRPSRSGEHGRSRATLGWTPARGVWLARLYRRSRSGCAERLPAEPSCVLSGLRPFGVAEAFYSAGPWQASSPFLDMAPSMLLGGRRLRSTHGPALPTKCVQGNRPRAYRQQGEANPKRQPFLLDELEV